MLFYKLFIFHFLKQKDIHHRNGDKNILIIPIFYYLYDQEQIDHKLALTASENVCVVVTQFSIICIASICRRHNILFPTPRKQNTHRIIENLCTRWKVSKPILFANKSDHYLTWYILRHFIIFLDATRKTTNKKLKRNKLNIYTSSNPKTFQKQLSKIKIYNKVNFLP